VALLMSGELVYFGSARGGRLLIEINTPIASPPGPARPTAI